MLGYRNEQDGQDARLYGTNVLAVPEIPGSQIPRSPPPKAACFYCMTPPSSLRKTLWHPRKLPLLLLRKGGPCDITNPERKVSVSKMFDSLVYFRIILFLYFSCNGFRNAKTQNLGVCVDGRDFRETAACLLTDIWGSGHSGISPESKARGQTDRSQLLQMLPDSRLGTQMHRRLISKRERSGQEQIAGAGGSAGVERELER